MTPLSLRGSLGSSSINLNRVKIDTKSDLAGAFQLFIKNTVKTMKRFWKSCLRNKYTCDVITIFICIISSRIWKLLLKQFYQSCALFPVKFFDRSILYPKQLNIFDKANSFLIVLISVDHGSILWVLLKTLLVPLQIDYLVIVSSPLLC